MIKKFPDVFVVSSDYSRESIASTLPTYSGWNTPLNMPTILAGEVYLRAEHYQYDIDTAIKTVKSNRYVLKKDGVKSVYLTKEMLSILEQSKAIYVPTKSAINLSKILQLQELGI